MENYFWRNISLFDKVEKFKAKYGDSFAGYVEKFDLSKDELEIGGCKIFRRNNCGIEGVHYDEHKGNIFFTFSDVEFGEFLSDIQFLFRVLQSQNKNSGCWFLNEGLGRQQVQLKCYLEACRKIGKVRSYRVSKSQNYFVLVSDNRNKERPIHVVEPYCQLYQHTQLSDGSPSKSAKVWKDVKDLNGKRFKKTQVHRI